MKKSFLPIFSHSKVIYPPRRVLESLMDKNRGMAHYLNVRFLNPVLKSG